MTPQEIVERCLELSRSDGMIVLVDETSSANLRWANNTLTTNGVMQARKVTVIAIAGAGTGASSGIVGRSAVAADDLEPLVRLAERAARDNGPAEDAQPLLDGDAATNWSDEPGQTSAGTFKGIAPALGETFTRGRVDGRVLYGYLEHQVETTYAGSSTGWRFRHEQPAGSIGITAKSADRTRSAWVGQAAPDVAEFDVSALDAELVRRLAWAERTVDLPAGRYDTVLPPSAVADLMIYAYWTMGARDANDGRTVYAKAGDGTRVGEKLSSRPVTLWSDPAAPGLECAPVALAHASSGEQSVFDNGYPLQRTDWIKDGTLAALIQTRHTARRTGLTPTLGVMNLGMDIADSRGGLDDVVAGVERGLLLTCLWYIREVDPQTLLLTGLTRDGVYLVENGEVTGAVNNFRFNESPVSLLDRISQASVSAPTLGREFGDYFPRTSMPAVRIPDFNMSSVSQAS
ncbi:metallopeptidase TldD-related protein [Phytoactinopolyspora limicola]|uniref:metallopeptidase TldD-related protein n=1 Tax=Phytoactinopolyspora limicola TaxID=2715536 RepID=UPI00140B24B0